MPPTSTHLPDALARIASGEELGDVAAEAAMGDLLAGRATPAQIGAFLMGLRVRGETAREVAGLVRAMRAASVKVTPTRRDLVDLCGTGGDGSGTFNISTAASLVVAAAGLGVAKHGNRSASSRCGSADVLEALGVPIDLGPEDAARAIDEHGFAFLFARVYHPAMRHVAGPRGELRVRTVFNLLGPLTNPAGVGRQLIGVFDDGVRPLVAGVLAELGAERAWVVHGEGGLDELSVAGRTRVTVVERGELREIEVVPEDVGIGRHGAGALGGGDATENAAIIERLLAGEAGACRDAVVLNAAAALVVGGASDDLAGGASLAADAIDSGRARKLLDAVRGRA